MSVVEAFEKRVRVNREAGKIVTRVLRVKNTAETKSFFIYGKVWCPRRSLDASRLYRYFVENDLRPVDYPKKADLIVIYTCGGFKPDEEISILTIEQVLKSVRALNKFAKVIVTGCLPRIDPERLKSYDTVLIIPPEDLGKLDSLIQAKVPYDACPATSIVYGVHDLYHGNLFQRIKRQSGFNTKLLRICAAYINQSLLHRSRDQVLGQKTYRLEIAKGCLGDCTYCAIKQAMGKFHSFPEEQIIENFRFGLKENYKDFALVAADIGCYGIDTNTSLPDLLKKLFAVEGDYKIALVDLNARWFVKYYPALLSVLKPNFRKVSRIILPIQSGSDRILKLMNRHYKIDEVKECLLDLQKNIPEIMLETHIIVGFPGETDEDFKESVELFRVIKFSKVDVYSYEDRPGTKSLNMPYKVESETIKKRARIVARSARARGAKATATN